MLNDKYKLKSFNQLLDILYGDNDKKRKEFNDMFSLEKEEYEEKEHHLYILLNNNFENSDIEFYCNDYENGEGYGYELFATEVDDYGDEGYRGNYFNCESDSKYKTRKTFYRSIRKDFENMLSIKLKYDEIFSKIYLQRLNEMSWNKFSKSYSDLTEKEIEELDTYIDAITTYNQFESNGWLED